jgi:ABC-type uncharacterized transport system fused permease/ATPase subunit
LPAKSTARTTGPSAFRAASTSVWLSRGLFLDKPDWLFLDEATSALDEKLEAEIYRMLSQVLPRMTIVSIGHRSTLIALHRRHIEMEPGEGGVFKPTPTIGVGSSAGALPMDFR